jgi:hypothetical protein
VLEAIDGYLGKRPPLVKDGEPAALTEIMAEGRTGPALSQPEALNHARDLLAPGMTTDAFILEMLADADLRARRSDDLTGVMEDLPK